MREGVCGRGGDAGEIRPADCDLTDFWECPGQAAPGKGAVSCTRRARAADIARKLAEPRIRGLTGLLAAELTVPFSVTSPSTTTGLLAAELTVPFSVISPSTTTDACVDTVFDPIAQTLSCDSCRCNRSAVKRLWWRSRYSRGVPGQLWLREVIVTASSSICGTSSREQAE